MTWSIATCSVGGEPVPAILLADGRAVAPPELKRWRTVLELLADWPHARDVLQTLIVQEAPPVEPDAILAPIRFPPKVICAGVNYRRHVAEMGGAIPDTGWTPFFFLKPPTTAVVGPTAPIVVADVETSRPDWEVELAAVIGVGGRDIPVGRALAHVAGYCVANDVSNRGVHRRDTVPTEAFRFDWFASKAADSSLPMGPGITPAFLVPDPQDLMLRLWVNDELQQQESTGDMICSVAELVSAASRFVTLEPGDVIPTGTPSGVGAGRGLFLRDGDVVRARIDGLGEIVNTVVDRRRMP